MENLAKKFVVMVASGYTTKEEQRKYLVIPADFIMLTGEAHDNLEDAEKEMSDDCRQSPGKRFYRVDTIYVPV